jgi:hypothetical protein
MKFNSYKQSGKLSKPNKEFIKVNPENRLEVLFVTDTPYWDGTILQFSGLNTRKFYTLIKDELVSWELFSDATLARFDLYYLRENKKQDILSSNDFLENCYSKIKQTSKIVRLEKNQKGSILKVGNRKSNHASRIYQIKDSLKFEYEMKGRFLSDQYSSLLKTNNLEEFENNLITAFFSYFGKLLSFQYSYLDWLVVRLRPLRKQKFLSSSLNLNTDYIHQVSLKTYDNRKQFFTLLQFLAYVKNLDYQRGSLGTTHYRRVNFRIKDFLTYSNQSNNSYQLNKKNGTVF